MKQEIRNGEATMQMGSEKVQRDQELLNMVTASISSPTYDLSLLNVLPQGLTPGFEYNQRLQLNQMLASLAAATPGTRFQLQYPLMSLPNTFAALPPTPFLDGTQPRYELLSWLNEQEKKASHGDSNVANNNNNNNNNTTVNHHESLYKKSGKNLSVKKSNKKSKSPVQPGLIGFPKHVPIKREDDDNDDITQTIIPIDKTSKGGQIKSKSKGDLQSVQLENNNNNHNNNKTVQDQQSNQGSRNKSFTCNICKRSFGYKHVLQNHERTHTGEKPYSCDTCDKKFTRDHHLKTHMRLHTGEKPYNCEYCDRQFVQVANLRRHLRVHTGEKPYACKECQSCFSDSNQLKAHMLIHKGQKPYFCEHCEGRFRRRHHLTHHKCMKVKNNKAFPHSSPDISPPASKQRERKARSTRRIVRMCDIPVSTVTTGLIPAAIPVQTHPEDLSLGNGNGLRNRQFSGSHSSVSASTSTSPASRGSQGSLGPFSHSGSSEQILSDEERSGSGESINNSSNGKHESDELPSPSQG